MDKPSSSPQIRVFNYAKGKMTRQYDESLAQYESGAYRSKWGTLDALDMGRRLAVEREYGVGGRARSRR